MFLLFRYGEFYPGGASEDFAGRFDTLDAALDAHRRASYVYDYADVYDATRDVWYDQHGKVDDGGTVRTRLDGC